ncbi:GerAB/ArcD/ProY family transporter [Paenibacillus amylolyticus]|nr:GerAB/ArcD/ProY family transporter [Paenibacillus amylolyticus]
MSASNGKISTMQAAIIVLNCMFNAGILILPRTLSKSAQTPDIWISMLLAGFFVIGIGIIVVNLSMRYPGKTVFEFTRSITGIRGSDIYGLMIIIYFLVLSSMEIRVMAEATDMYLLQSTPYWATVIVFLWSGLYAVTGGLSVMIRLITITLPFTLIIFIVGILLSSKLFEFNNLVPMFGDGIIPVLKGVQPAVLSYSGYEMMLILTAYMTHPKESTKTVIWSISIVTLICSFTMVMVVGCLSLSGITTRTFPTLDLLRSFEMEGVFFERFELLLLIFWIVQIFATFTIKYYFTSIGIQNLFRLRKVQPIYYLLLPLIYLVSTLPKSLFQALVLGDILGNVSAVLFAVIPLLLLLIDIIRKGARIR